MKPTYTQLEDMLTTVNSQGFPLLMVMIQDHINAYNRQLIESVSSENDSRIKGKIQSLEQDVLMIKDKVQKMWDSENKKLAK
jgi:hypothetical protein